MHISLTAKKIEEFGPVKRTATMPGGPSIKFPSLYYKLREKGYDKSKAAAISNSSYSKIKSGQFKRHSNRLPHAGKGGQSRSKASAAALKQGLKNDRKHYGKVNPESTQKLAALNAFFLSLD